MATSGCGMENNFTTIGTVKTEVAQAILHRPHAYTYYSTVLNHKSRWKMLNFKLQADDVSKLTTVLRP